MRMLLVVIWDLTLNLWKYIFHHLLSLSALVFPFLYVIIL